MTDDQQRADHFEHVYSEASEGRCAYSGLTIGSCKASICDCFQFPWVEPDHVAAEREMRESSEVPHFGPRLRHRVAVLKNIRHDVVMDVDGYWKWFPRWDTGGGYTQEDLFVLADLLREANRKWDEQVRRDLEAVVPAADDAATLLVLGPGEGHDLLAGVESEPEDGTEPPF